MDVERRENVKRICSSFSNPIAVMDFDFRCLYCSKPDLIKPGSLMKRVFLGSVTLPPEKPIITAAEIKDAAYSVRLAELEDRLYICEFFDNDTLLSIMENSGFYERVFPIIDSVERNTALLWHGLHILESRLSEDGQDEALICTSQLTKNLTRLNSATKNITEYLHMLSFSSKPKSVVDLFPLLVELVARCNTALLKCGRYVDILCAPDVFYVYAEQRHVVTAAVNAIQNALLYSPRDCIPHVFLTRETIDRKQYIALTILNDNALFIEDNSFKEPRVNIRYQRTGFGIPIIKRFAEMCGGGFSMSEENGIVKVTVLMRMAEDAYEKSGKTFISSSFLEYYRTDIPDILDLQMEEVNEIFG